jgi:hypothetical protein
MLLDAKRELRHRVGTMILRGTAALLVLLSMLFILQAAQLELSQLISPALANLAVAAGLLAMAAIMMLLVWLRLRRDRSSSDIGRAALATLPLANTMVRKANPQLLLAEVILAGAACLGRKMRS